MLFGLIAEHPNHRWQTGAGHMARHLVRRASRSCWQSQACGDANWRSEGFGAQSSQPGQSYRFYQQLGPLASPKAWQASAARVHLEWIELAAATSASRLIKVQSIGGGEWVGYLANLSIRVDRGQKIDIAHRSCLLCACVRVFKFSFNVSDMIIPARISVSFFSSK